MIKRLIFDLDDTLIMWKKEYISFVINTFNKLNIPYDLDLLKKIDMAIDNYRMEFSDLTKEKLLYVINKNVNANYPIEFIDTLLKEMYYCSEKASDELIDTLEYLNNKYDLVILTDWFEEVQSERLKIAGIDKYFNNIYGASTNLLKPNSDAFIKAMGTYTPNECIMIGDSVSLDIDGAKSLGIDSIYCNFKNNDIVYDGKVINKIEELKVLL